MRGWLCTAILGGVAALGIAGFFSISALAGKQADPVKKPESEKAPDVVLASGSESASKLPLTRIVLFNSGVGYFERQGTVEGDVRVDLSAPAGDINDMLKSLVVQDQDGGHVSAVTLDSMAPTDRALRSFAIDLSTNPPLAQILNQARGERVEVVLQQSSTSQPGTLNGVIIGIEKQIVTAGKDNAAEVAQMNLWCADGARSVKLSDVQRVRFLNPVLENEFRKALDVLTQGHDTQKKTVSLIFTGKGKRRVRVGYVVENPIWKTSYRLVLDKEKPPFLQGWAVVENNTDEDWNKVVMGLVAGRPISFQMDLYSPIYVPRPVVEPELFASLRPPEYGGPINRDRVEREREATRMLQEMQTTPSMPTLGGGLGVGGLTLGGGLAGGLPLGGAARTPAGSANLGDAGWPASPSAGMNLQQGITAAASTARLGDSFQYRIDHPISLGRQKSAMLPIVNRGIEGSRLSIYNEKVHAKFPLLGLRLKNNSELHLNQGPITVFEGGAYAGDARMPDLQPGEERLISYAIDLGTEVVPTSSADNGRRTAVKIVKGVVHVKTRTTETKTYSIINRSDTDRTILIEHPFRSAFHLVNTDKPIETAADVYRFEVKVPRGKSAKHTIVEERDDGEQIAIDNSDDGRIQVILKDPVAGKEIKEALEKALTSKAELSRTLQDVQTSKREIERIKTDQPRLRENLKTIPQTDPLAKKILQKLNDQENEIEKHEARVRELDARADRQRKELDAYLAGLNVP